ncbi:transposase, MuDR, MULE transposase domain protein [Tanacetum coccineum]
MMVGEIEGGCFGKIKSYLKNEKLVCDVIGDMNVTLKDPSSTMSGTIHHNVLLDDGHAKAIIVGSALILHNVYVFCPKSSNYYLNITIRNLVNVFQKDIVAEHADGASGSKISYEETLSQMM